MNIRFYKSEDINEIATLFYNTVHTVNARDYSEEQLFAWTGEGIDEAKWNASLMSHYSLIAEENGAVIGFADLDDDYLDRLYIHSQWQGKGVATALCEAIEQQAALNKAQVLKTHASITARPFFEHRGYKVVSEQQVERNAVMLTNFVMHKIIGRALV